MQQRCRYQAKAILVMMHIAAGPCQKMLAGRELHGGMMLLSHDSNWLCCVIPGSQVAHAIHSQCHATDKLRVMTHLLILPVAVGICCTCISGCSPNPLPKGPCRPERWGDHECAHKHLLMLSKPIAFPSGCALTGFQLPAPPRGVCSSFIPSLFARVLSMPGDCYWRLNKSLCISGWLAAA